MKQQLRHIIDKLFKFKKNEANHFNIKRKAPFLYQLNKSNLTDDFIIDYILSYCYITFEGNSYSSTKAIIFYNNESKENHYFNIILDKPLKFTNDYHIRVRNCNYYSYSYSNNSHIVQRYRDILVNGISDNVLRSKSMFDPYIWHIIEVSDPIKFYQSGGKAEDLFSPDFYNIVRKIVIGVFKNKLLNIKTY